MGDNRLTAIPVAQARGVVLLVLARLGIEVHEYQPAEVKMSITGYGKADKRQVQRMLMLRLALVEAPTSDHASDALALALTHMQLRRLNRMLRP